MKVTMNVERIREALENPEQSGLSEVELSILAAMAEMGGAEEEQRTQQVRKAKRKPRPTRIKKAKKK